MVFVDLDNTLYDWLGFFGPAMRGLCTRLSELSGCPVSVLYDEFKTVFIKHGSVEYSFAIQELPSLQRLHPSLPRPDLAKRYWDAVEVYQARRRRYLYLYPDVRKTLQDLREREIKIIAVSDARRFQVMMRLRQLRLLELIDGVCCVEDHATEEPDHLARIRRFDHDFYSPHVENIYILPSGVRKPSQLVLEWLLGRLGIAPDEAIYVGDSLIKDIPMAQNAKVYDCWAEYGMEFSPIDMATLVRVTDWTPEAVTAALSATPDSTGVYPSYTAGAFHEISDLISMSSQEWPRQVSIHRPKEMPPFELGPESSIKSHHYNDG